MTKHLFLFTITPVQSFVAEARKAQDFFEGSHLLSKLADCAIARAQKQKNRVCENCPMVNECHAEVNENAQKNPSCDIIFPNTGIESKPNRFMAVVETSNINKFGNELKAGVEQFFCDWVDKSWNCIENKPENYEFQKKNYLSITWVAVEYDPEKDDYFAKYKEIESLLGGAKNIRDFKQLPDTEVGRKCSVCGERNALVFAGKKPRDAQQDSILLERKNHNYYLMNDNEGLCAICAAKRFDKEAEKYKSTSDIALLYTLKKFKEKGGEITDYDPQYLVMMKENDDPLSFEHLTDELKRQTKELSKKIKNEKISLTPYYALVAFDGDSMGKTLGGGKCKKGANLREFQEKLTQALGDFALKVNNEGISKYNEGRVVYAGGEDFFGFVNLHYLFPVMTRLRQMFDDEVHNKLKDYLAEGEKLSFSAGITIAHVKTPLSVVIGKTREMEKKAKNRSSEKDAFAIAVMKHSGEINCIEMPWRNKDGRFYMDDMQDLIDSMTKGELSNTFYQVLQKEFLPIVDESGIVYENDFEEDSFNDDEETRVKDMLVSESKRAVKRAVSASEEEKNEVVGDICRKVENLLEASTIVVSKEPIKRYRLDIVNFFHIFHIIDFIVRETGGLQ